MPQDHSRVPARTVTLPRRLVLARKSFCRHVRAVLEAQACAIQFTSDALGGRILVGCDGLPVGEARRLGAPPFTAADGHTLVRAFSVTGGMLRIIVLRDAGAPPFTAAEGRTLDSVGGLAGSFVELVGAAAELSGLWQSSLQVLDRLALGIVLVGAKGEVLASNRTARDMALTHAADPDDNAARPAPHRLLHSLSQSVNRTADAAAAFSRLESGEEGGISVLATPLGRGSGRGRCAPAGTALFLSDGGRLFASYQDWLCRFYGLTRLEARLVTQIVEGRSLGEVAAALRVSIHTVRTYLKQIFAKTGVHRQADLVKLVVGGIGQVRADQEAGEPPSLIRELRNQARDGQ